MSKDDFEFISDRDISVDENFASQGYWKGVAVHFFRNKFAVTDLILIISVMLVLDILYGIIDPRIRLTSKEG